MTKPFNARRTASRLARAAAGIALALVPAACTPGKNGGEEPRVTTQRIAGPAGSLRVDDGGKGGLAVVFLHGFAGSADHWSSQLAS